MAIVYANDKNFDSEIASGKALVDFYADWCGPCRMIAPVLEEIDSEMAGEVKIIKLDVDAYPAIAQRFGVMSIPTLILFKDGQVAKQVIGFQPKPMLVDIIKNA